MKCDSTHVQVITYTRSQRNLQINSVMYDDFLSQMLRDSSQDFNGLHLGVHLCRLIGN